VVFASFTLVTATATAFATSLKLVTIVNRSSDGRISPTTSNQSFTLTFYSETRFDHVLCSPKQGHVSLHCTQHASPRLDKRPLTSKQDANISPTISNQCFTSALYSEPRLDHVRCSPKRGYLSPLCLRRYPLYSTPFPLAYDETPLIPKQDKPKTGQEKKV